MRRLAALLLPLIVLAPVRAIRAQRTPQREAPEVRELELRGVHVVSSLDLARSIATTASQCKNLLLTPFCLVSRSPTFIDRQYLNRDEFRRDVLRILVFYWKRGYREAQVDTAVTRMGPGTVRVLFDIREGPATVISAMRVEFDSTLFTPRQIQKMAILRVGDPLNLVVLDTMRLNYQLAMWDKGFGDAVVDTAITVNAASRNAAVYMRLVPRWKTTIGTITVRGNDQVNARTIQNSILLRPGRVFRYNDMTESQRNLYESDLFKLALFFIPPQPDSVKNVEIDLRETKMREMHLSTGFNTVDFLQGDTRFTNYNTFGGARRLDVTAAIGNIGSRSLGLRPGEPVIGAESFYQPTWQVSADVKQPAWLQKPENALSLGGFAHRRVAQQVFVDRGYGGQMAFTRTLAPRAQASAAYRFEVTRVEASDVYFCVNYGVCDGPTVESLRLHQRLSPIQMSASIDRSDIPFSPTKGFIGRLDLEHASSITVSDYRYNRADGELSFYTHFRYPSRDPRSQVLAAHIHAGFVRPLANGATGLDLLHPRSRFYAGGAHSARGYDENQLGPRILTIAPDSLATVAGCNITDAAILAATCDPSTPGLATNQFTARPVGGTGVIEASVEFRVPFSRKMEWAAFVDAGKVWGSRLQSGTSAQSIKVDGASAITPGVGFRYRSPVGPIRIDMGYNPKSKDMLSVVTAVRDSLGRQKLVLLNKRREFSNIGTATNVMKIFNSVMLHLSIGEAY